MNDTPEREITVFTEALQLAPSERLAYLERVGASDPDLRRQIEALLRAFEGGGDLLGEAAPGVPTQTLQGPEIGESAGDRIGRYKLLQQIGEGGYGVVFMAEQVEPVRRKVALKVIKPGMDTKSVIARFEAERQALSLMDHPSIAKVFDAGTTDSGRPYFVMELVRGCKITDYCDQHSVSTEDRLRLFVQICHAVQHAHQKGIIHRDIKPSNILVTQTAEGAALPVVIDFGIAKATSNQKLTEKTLFTAFEMLIGTPAYMSPEQAALSNFEVDTRTDVYSLGVLLYELLTGSTPFDTAELLKSGLDEVRRVIREREPELPSTRLSRMAAPDLKAVAHHRQSEPNRLIRGVRGDLDWIVIKALEKDRARRYETANGLALDVKRHLENEVISARPPSGTYRLGKLVQRNKLLFLGIGVVSMLLVASLVVVSFALARARDSAAMSEQVKRFIEDMLKGVGPEAARGRDITLLLEILEQTGERIGIEIKDQPAVEAELRRLIGQLYFDLGKYVQAEAMQRAACSLNRKLHGPMDEKTAASLNDLAETLFMKENLEEAEQLNLEALQIQTNLFGLENAGVATSLDNLGGVYRRQRRLDEAEKAIRKGLEIRRRLFGNESLPVAESLHNFAVVLGDLGRPIEAETEAQRLLETRRKLHGEEDLRLADALDDAAWAAGLNGKVDEKEKLYTQALKIRQELQGDEHPNVAKEFYNLGGIKRERGDLTSADGLMSAAISIQQKLLGEEHPETLYSLGTLALILEAQGKWADAEAMHRKVFASWRTREGGTAPRALYELEGLVRTLLAQRRLSEAEELLNEILTPAFLKDTLVQRSEKANLLIQRVEILGRQKSWREATTDAALVLELRPSDHYRYHQLAGLLTITREHPTYRKLCQRILTTFGDTKDPYIAERAAADCLLLPDSGADMQVVDQLATRAVENGRREGGWNYFQACKALSDYRRGNLSSAIEWAANAIDGGETLASAKACAVKAMAQWKLGARDSARAMLAKGNELAPNEPAASSTDLGATWLAWVFARISLDEAIELIGPAPTEIKQSTSP